LQGNIYIQDVESGEVRPVTPQQYNDLLQSGKNYQVLTNYDFLSMRANDPNFAFKNEVLSKVVSNGIGID
jgi:hypothetical protein